MGPWGLGRTLLSLWINDGFVYDVRMLPVDCWWHYVMTECRGLSICSRMKKTRSPPNTSRIIRRQFSLFADVGKKMNCLPSSPRCTTSVSRCTVVVVFVSLMNWAILVSLYHWQSQIDLMSRLRVWDVRRVSHTDISQKRQQNRMLWIRSVMCMYLHIEIGFRCTSSSSNLLLLLLLLNEFTMVALSPKTTRTLNKNKNKMSCTAL